MVEVVNGSQGSCGGFPIKIPENTLVYKRGTTDLLILTSKHSQVPWEPPTTSPLTSLEVGREGVRKGLGMKNMRNIWSNNSVRSKLFLSVFIWDFDVETSPAPLGTTHDLSPDLPGGREVSTECFEAV